MGVSNFFKITNHPNVAISIFDRFDSLDANNLMVEATIGTAKESDLKMPSYPHPL